MQKLKIHYILNDDNKANSFNELYKRIYPNKTLEEKNTNNQSINGFTFSSIVGDNKIVLFLGCKIVEKLEEKNIDDFTNGLIDLCKRIFYPHNITDAFINLDDNSVKYFKDNLQVLMKKYKKKTECFFYNFGKTYITNKTFFDSDYSIYSTNVAHEAINRFKTDDDKRYFYLCKDGALPTGYFIPSTKIPTSLPLNYLDLNKVTLVNYSKVSDGGKSNFIVLQKVFGLLPFDGAFKERRDEQDYINIKYNKKNLLEIFDENVYEKIDKDGKIKRTTENYPYITFELKKDGYVKKPKLMNYKDIIFNIDDLDNFSSHERQFNIFEGTNLYDFFDKLLVNEDQWEDDTALSLDEYLNSENFKDDYEEDYLLKLINRESKETFYSKLFTYTFANSIEILDAFVFKQFEHHVKEIINVDNEKYNIDVMVKYKDDHDQKHILIIENKLFADFSKDENKELFKLFREKENLRNIIKNVEKEFSDYRKASTLKPDNLTQLDKYWRVSRVLLKMEDIKDCYLCILCPEFKVDNYETEKNKYYCGECYKVISYKSLKEAIDDIIKNENSLFHLLSDDKKQIISQVRKSIWPYISDSYSYYMRTMSNRFARRTIKTIK